jgi:hypothetical protein
MEIHPLYFARIEDEEIVAAALHLGETHTADSTGWPVRGGGEKMPLGTEQWSRIFPR